MLLGRLALKGRFTGKASWVFILLFLSGQIATPI